MGPQCYLGCACREGPEGPASLTFDDGWWLHLQRRSAFLFAPAAWIALKAARSVDFAKVTSCAKPSSGIAQVALAVNARFVRTSVARLTIPPGPESGRLDLFQPSGAGTSGWSAPDLTVSPPGFWGLAKGALVTLCAGWAALLFWGLLCPL